MNARSDGGAVEIATSRVVHSRGTNGPVSIAPQRTLTPGEVQALLDERCYGLGQCAVGSSDGLNALFLPEDPAEPADDGEPGRVVTIADVERFLPAIGALHAEPDGWAVIGVPANFWVVVRPVVVDGDLLGETAQVRFVPRLYRWDYGDGSLRTTTTPGADWADLGQDELSETATSHLYKQKAAVDAAVTVVWSASYRVGDGAWVPVAGAVTSTTPGAAVLVVRERTVLTAR